MLSKFVSYSKVSKCSFLCSALLLTSQSLSHAPHFPLPFIICSSVDFSPGGLPSRKVWMWGVSLIPPGPSDECCPFEGFGRKSHPWSSITPMTQGLTGTSFSCHNLLIPWKSHITFLLGKFHHLTYWADLDINFFFLTFKRKTNLLHWSDKQQ